ncbi:hypothetical protein [Beijerinckia indica]|uniref:Uncharacterized protein n=1 Tax=Beijerinckia indica subsp. indica (strain ATCC 9039 / DSM 1715 / NCIMB 8712) TaxID=395963 RepID=B2IBZ8_BEII9|nr:hypothetical protein [Beijerinckia indica]ACB95253.1 hypothetical protein Bind_1622 [Beijerinckia indica subsp. indica ATCC 9039]
MTTGYDIKYAKAFFDLPIEARLTKIIDNSFPDWVNNCNTGVSLIYANACKMVEAVTEKVLETSEDHLGDFEVFSSSTAHEVETGYDLFNPDTGALVAAGTNGVAEGYFYFLETGIRCMSSDNAKFEPRWLTPEDPAIVENLVKTYQHVFPVQLRFWAQDAEDYQSLYDTFKATLKDFPKVSVVEKQLSAPLRAKFRFRPKRKEQIELVETPVTAIAIGLEL